MTYGSLWPVGVSSQPVTYGLFPGLFDLLLQVIGVVGLIYDMWLFVTFWCIFQSMTCPILICLFGQIDDMWLTVNLFYNRTKVWQVTCCDIVFFYSYICMTHGSQWAIGVHLKQYKIGLFFKNNVVFTGSPVRSPVTSEDFTTTRVITRFQYIQDPPPIT